MNDRSEIPDSWLHLALGDVIDYGKTVKTEPSMIPTDAWVLELEDIEKDTSQLLQRLTFSERQSKSTKNKFKKGDVLYGKLRPYLNKVVIADQDGYCTTEILPLKPNLAVDGQYLFYWLKHPTFLDYVDSVSHGIQMPRLGTEAGLKAPLILAPINEQRRIVAKLDSLLARSRRAREELERVAGLCDRYRQAVLAAAYEGLLTKNADSMSLGAVATEVRNGLSRKPSETPPGIKILRISSVRKGMVNVNNTRFYVLESTEDASRYYLQKGDLLFTRYNGNADYVAVCGMFRNSTEEVFVYPDKLIRVRVDSAVIVPEFVEIIFQTPQIRNSLREYIKTAAGQHGISGSDLKCTLIPVPHLNEQKEIVLRVEKLFNAIAQIEAEYQKALKLCDRLDQAILTKAFSGELVPQDPTDEPADVLLDRIHAEKQDSPKDKKLKSKRKSEAQLHQPQTIQSNEGAIMN